MKKNKKVTRKTTTKHGVHKHVAKVYHATPKFVHGMIAGAFIGLMLVTAVRSSSSAQALSISGPQDCNANSVVDCGAPNTNDLKADYNKYKGVRDVYAAAPFNISSSDINSIGSTAVAGEVDRNGDVKVNGKVVATDAISAGRTDYAGSTPVSTSSGTFYKRPPSVSYANGVQEIPAYVVMKNGKFQYGIMVCCCNPVSATPVPTQTHANPNTHANSETNPYSHSYATSDPDYHGDHNDPGTNTSYPNGKYYFAAEHRSWSSYRDRYSISDWWLCGTHNSPTHQKTPSRHGSSHAPASPGSRSLEDFSGVTVLRVGPLPLSSD